MKYLVFVLLVIAAVIYGWFGLQTQKTLSVLVNNETLQTIQFDIVGDACEGACLNNTGKSEVLGSKAHYQNTIYLNANGELRFMLRHTTLGLNHLLLSDTADLNNTKMIINIKSQHHIDVRFVE